MDNNKISGTANEEVEKSKDILDDSQRVNETKSEQENQVGGTQPASSEEGSGLFTTDGKELPKIEGGYDLIDPGGSLGDDELVSV